MSKASQELTGVTLEGRYRLLRRMGRGGMGSVYEAERVLLPERYAVKVLHRHMAEDSRQRKRFLREAQAAYTIKHDHVVKILDFGEQPRPYFVMEYLEGYDLKELLKREGKMPWARARNILLQVAAALEAAHALGIVHRDVKPSNVFALAQAPVGASHSGPDFVKVLDFGIAKVAESGLHVTRTDEMMGTARYMSPEQALATHVDPRSDVYALGIVMFELLTGRVPFDASSPFLVVDQHVKEPPPRPSSIEPSISAAVEAVVLKAIAKLPHQRFQGMDEFAAAIRSTVDGGHPVVEVPPAMSLADPSTGLIASSPSLPPSSHATSSTGSQTPSHAVSSSSHGGHADAGPPSGEHPLPGRRSRITFAILAGVFAVAGAVAVALKLPEVSSSSTRSVSPGPDDSPSGGASSVLSEVMDPATEDARALDALREAESHGAQAPTLAQAAFARGRALSDEPERAARFLHWAAAKDTDFAEPLFELAKLSIAKGKPDEALSLLEQVKSRDGEALLRRIEIEPTWAPVRDKPGFAALRDQP